jgi:hypothetical protein
LVAIRGTQDPTVPTPNITLRHVRHSQDRRRVNLVVGLNGVWRTGNCSSSPPITRLPVAALDLDRNSGKTLEFNQSSAA